MKQALKKSHSAPARWRENHDAVKEMHFQFSAPVGMMGCDTAKWSKMDSWVRDAYHGISSNH